MISVLKYLRGYLRIKVSGFSPERFMNLCSNRGILLWDISGNGESFEMNIHIKGFRELKPIVKKTGTRVTILKRYGLPFFLPKLFQRKIFVLSFSLILFFIIWSSNYIWRIDLCGNQRITEDIFFDFLDGNDIRIGMPKKSLQIEELEKKIRKNFPDVTWTSAKMEGTKLYIEIKENESTVQVKEEKSENGSNLLSDREGTIVSIIVRKGVPQVAIGDYVEKDTILVSGLVPVYNEDATVKEYIYVDADADIVMEFKLPYEDNLAYDYIEKKYTGRQNKKFYVRIGDKKLMLANEKSYLVYDSIIRESVPLLFQKLQIPFGIGQICEREYYNIEHLYKAEQVKEYFENNLNNFLVELKEKGVQIIEKNVKIETNTQGFTNSGEILIRNKIGVTQSLESSIGEADNS